MKIEIDVRPEAPKFVIDGFPLDTNQIDANLDIRVDSELGLTVTMILRPDELVHTDSSGVTVTATAEAIVFSGTDPEAVAEAAGQVLR